MPNREPESSWLAEMYKTVSTETRCRRLRQYLVILKLDLSDTKSIKEFAEVINWAHSWGNTNLDDIKREKGYNKNKAYSQSKLSNILCTHLLAKRLEGTGVTAYSLHPGVVQTDLWRHLNPAQQAVMKMVSPFTKNSVQGAQTTIYCAVDPGLETKSGGYYSVCAPATCSRAATDDSVAQKLWDLSCQMLSISWD